MYTYYFKLMTKLTVYLCLIKENSYTQDTSDAFIEHFLIIYYYFKIYKKIKILKCS